MNDQFVQESEKKLFILYTEPRKERIFFNVFGASRDTTADVLFSISEIPNSEM